MSFNDDITLDTSNVRRGGRGAAIGGGIGGFGIIGAIIFFMITGQVPDFGQSVTAPQSGEYTQTDIAAECQTGADANASTDCRMVAGMNSLDTFWNAQLATEVGIRQVEPTLHLFSGAVQTACGTGSSDMGPFYCSGDDTIYIDTTFFEQLDSMGAENKSLAQLYILAHEFGHHIQYMTGDLQRVDHNSSGPTSSMVRSELQADCLAGSWIHNASTTNDPDTGVPFMLHPTQSEIQSALAAAQAVGDDRIYENAGMQANPDNFSHGSAEKREQWLTTGMQNGTYASCNTWDVAEP